MAIRLTKSIRRFFSAPGLGKVRLGDIADPTFGKDASLPQKTITGAYIDLFLAASSKAITGRILLAGPVGILLPQDPAAAVVRVDAEALGSAEPLAGGPFDCIVLIDQLGMVDDPIAALRKAAKVVKPGGTLLATLPGVACDYPGLSLSHQWRFSHHAARRMCADIFGAAKADISSFGNILAAVSCAAALPADRLTQNELSAGDQSYPLMVAIRITQ